MYACSYLVTIVTSNNGWNFLCRIPHFEPGLMVSSPHDASNSCVDSDANIVYPSCAVTRAMAKGAQSNIGHDSEFTGSIKSKILDEGSTDNVNEIESQVELADTILSMAES